MNALVWNVLQVGFTTSIIILPVFIFCAVLRRRYPARIICLLWMILSVRLLVPVQITFPNAPVIIPQDYGMVSGSPARFDTIQPAIPKEQPIDLKDSKTNQQFHDEQPMTPTQKDTNKQPQKKLDFSILLAVVWLVGVGTFLTGYFYAHWHFLRQVRQTAQEVQNEEVLMMYEQEKERLGIKRDIPILQSKMVDGPMMAGLLHPMLLLPEVGIASSDAGLILRHELTHYKYGDLYSKLLFLLEKCVHWFNPVVHLLAWQGAQDLEIACDQAVIHGLDTEAKRQYGQCILNHAARRIGHRQCVFTTQFTGGKKVMKIRLQALFTQPKKRRGIIFLFAVLFAGTMVGCSFAVGAGKEPDAETVRQMDTLARLWCDAQKNQLTPVQAKTLLGGSLKEDFKTMCSLMDDVQPEDSIPVDNLPMDA